jgi:hypothetical protein
LIEIVYNPGMSAEAQHGQEGAERPAADRGRTLWHRLLGKLLELLLTPVEISVQSEV